MKKLILTLIIAMLFLFPFANTFLELTKTNTIIDLKYNLNEISTDTFNVEDNLIDITLSGSQIDNDLISILPTEYPYTNTLSFMIDGLLNGITPSYNILPSAYPSISSQSYSVTFSPDSSMAVVTFNVSPFIRLYDTSTDPWESANTLDIYPSVPIRTTQFSPDGSHLAVGFSNSVLGSPYLLVFRTDTTPFYRLPDPIDVTGTVVELRYSNDGNYLLVGHTNAPYVSVYDASTIPYTLIETPFDTPPTSTVVTSCFIEDSNYLVLSYDVDPYVFVYDTSTTPFTYLPNMLDIPLYTVPRNIIHTKNKESLVFSSLKLLSIYDMTEIPFSRTYFNNTSPNGYKGLALNHNDTILVMNNGSSMLLRDFTNLNISLNALLDSNPTGSISDIEFSPDYNFLGVSYTNSPYYAFFDTNLTYFDILDQDNNVLLTLDIGTAYTNEMVNVAVTDVTAISFRSQNIDELLESSLTIDVTLIDGEVDNPFIMTPILKFLPLLSFMVVVSIFVFFIIRKNP